MAKKTRPLPDSLVLCVLRHADAGDALADPARDAKRALSARGRKEAKRLGKSLARLGLLPRDVWTSRLARAAETAERALAAAKGDAPVRATAGLSPDADPERVLATLSETPPPPRAEPAPPAKKGGGRATTVRWLVGHDPHVTRLVARLVGAPAGSIAMAKGTAAVVEFGRDGTPAEPGRLVALISADATKALLHRR